MSTEKKWYVYLLCDPDTKVPFYVGKGTGNRINEHEGHLDCFLDGNPTKKLIIQQILIQGKQVFKKKIAEFDNEQDALIYEWGMISLYGESLANIQHGSNSLPKPGRRAKPLLVSKWEAIRILRVTTSQLDRLRRDGVIRTIRITTKNIVFVMEDLENYIRNRRAS